MRVLTYVISALFFLSAAAQVEAAATAKENYKTHCTSCHGPDGKSQTRLGKRSGAKDLSDKAAIAKLNDEELFKTIKLGRKNSKGE
jgi:cytochrome c6